MEKYKYLRPEETGRLYCVIDLDDSRHAIRNKAIFLIAKYCALRVSEVGMLRISDYDSVQNQIFCRREKNSNSNMLRIIDPDVSAAMKEYISIRDSYPESEFLFVSQMGNPISRKTLAKLMKKVGTLARLSPDKRHFHVLKHTRAIELGECGLDTKEIQWWLGHKSISNTMIYHQFTTRQQQTLYDKLLLNTQKQ